MFNVGDYVRVKQSGATLNKDDVHKVVEVDKGRFGPRILLERHPNQAYIAELFEIVEEPKPLVIEIGDEIGFNAYYGKEIIKGIVVEINQQYGTGDCYWCDAWDNGMARGYIKKESITHHVKAADLVVAPVEEEEPEEVEVKTWIVYHPKAGQPGKISQTVFMQEDLATQFVESNRRSGRTLYATKVITTKIKI